ncbi:uncharacterized protein LOC144109886 [Amblyomma americanum]
MPTESRARKFRRTRKRRVDVSLQLPACAEAGADPLSEQCSQLQRDVCVTERFVPDTEDVPTPDPTSQDAEAGTSSVFVDLSSDQDLCPQVDGRFDYEADHERADEDVATFRHQLQTWAVESGSSHAAVTSLLKVLRSHKCFSSLPSSARALLQTPKKSNELSEISEGQYRHFGVEAGIREILGQCRDLPPELNLTFHIDGLPLSKSSRGQFWTILGRISNLKHAAPFVTSVFFGDSKPRDANEFLYSFVEELNVLLSTGIAVEAFTIPVKLKAIVCDAPAKPFVLCVKNHTGYYSCTKCTVKGAYIEGRVGFPNISSELRTDCSFRQRSQEQYHTGSSIVEQLPIDIVRGVPLDYMHLVCLGVVHKLLVLWFRGPKAIRLGSKVRIELSVRNVKAAPFVPCELNRKPLSLTDLDRWKATEFRFFLLYGGPVLLSSLLPSQMYENFLALRVAITILSMPNGTKSEVQYAGQLLNHFVKGFTKIYGKEHASHNVHGLCHLASDVEHLGPLDSWSAFPFEYHMSTLKRLLRKPERPLEQLSNRLSQQGAVLKEAQQMPNFPLLTGQHESGPLIAPCQGPQFKKVKLPGSVVLAPGKRTAAAFCKMDL